MMSQRAIELVLKYADPMKPEVRAQFEAELRMERWRDALETVDTWWTDQRPLEDEVDAMLIFERDVWPFVHLALYGREIGMRWHEDDDEIIDGEAQSGACDAECFERDGLRAASTRRGE